MKSILWILVACLLSTSGVFGKILNGYESQLKENKHSLQHLKSLLSDHDRLSSAQRRHIKKQIQNLVNFFGYYELTEQAIFQLQIISPDMFSEMDNIVDKRGRPTDVYIKLIPKENSAVALSGVSFFKSESSDEDANLSEYGVYSVSIDVWICDTALILLSHELGHVKYIVPNLASYTQYYKREYGANHQLGLCAIGHNPSDKSGKLANTFVQRFVQDRHAYKQEAGRKPERITAMYYQIRKDMSDKDQQPIESPVASRHSF